MELLRLLCMRCILSFICCQVLLEILQSIGRFETSNYDSNLLLHSALATMKSLLNFGLYMSPATPNERKPEGSVSSSTTQFSLLLRILISLLGTQGEEHFTYDTLSAPIIDAKLLILDMLLLAMDLRLSPRLREIFFFFDRNLSAAYKKPSKSVVQKGDLKPFPYNSDELQELFKRLFSAAVPNTDIVLFPDPLTSSGELLTVDMFTISILGLSKYQGHAEMQSRAFAMLIRHRGQKEALVAAMKASCLVVHPQLRQANSTIQAEVENLHSQVKWLAYPASASTSEAIRTGRAAIPRWCNMCTEGSLIHLDGNPLQINQFFATKLAQTLFNHGAHKYAIRILRLEAFDSRIRSANLDELLRGCDLDNDQMISENEYELINTRVSAWVFGEGTDDTLLPAWSQNNNHAGAFRLHVYLF